MASETDISVFIELLNKFLSAIPFAEFPGNTSIIVNPTAGIYRSLKSLKHVNAELSSFMDSLSSENALPSVKRTVEIHITTTLEEGRIVADAIAEKAAESDGQSLILTAGGDGTANILCSRLLECDSRLLGKISIFRLPMGTGNDGLDSQTTADAWRTLSLSDSVKTLSAVRVRLSHGATRYAFNIASVGLDGWVTHLTNRIKKVIPGSFYSLMVDVAALFYEKRVHVAPMDVCLDDGDECFTENLLLLAMGVSGHRTYGNNKLVLPGEDNICAITTVPFFKKFKLKNAFYVGNHVDFKETIMKKARKLKLSYGFSIPMQFDGEVIWLKPDDFPVELEIVPTGIRVLTPVKSAPGV